MTSAIACSQLVIFPTTKVIKRQVYRQQFEWIFCLCIRIENLESYSFKVLEFEICLQNPSPILCQLNFHCSEIWISNMLSYSICCSDTMPFRCSFIFLLNGLVYPLQ